MLTFRRKSNLEYWKSNCQTSKSKNFNHHSAGKTVNYSKISLPSKWIAHLQWKFSRNILENITFPKTDFQGNCKILVKTMDEFSITSMNLIWSIYLSIPSSCSIVGKPLRYHESDQGSIPHEGHTIKSHQLLTIFSVLAGPILAAYCFRLLNAITCLFQNISKFCTFFPNFQIFYPFSTFLCPFSKKLHPCPYFLE